MASICLDHFSCILYHTMGVFARKFTVGWTINTVSNYRNFTIIEKKLKKIEAVHLIKSYGGEDRKYLA